MQIYEFSNIVTNNKNIAISYIDSDLDINYNTNVNFNGYNQITHQITHSVKTINLQLNQLYNDENISEIISNYLYENVNYNNDLTLDYYFSPQIDNNILLQQNITELEYRINTNYDFKYNFKYNTIIMNKKTYDNYKQFYKNVFNSYEIVINNFIKNCDLFLVCNEKELKKYCTYFIYFKDYNDFYYKIITYDINNGFLQNKNNLFSKININLK